MHERVSETLVPGTCHGASVYGQNLSLQERGLRIILGSECCMDKIITAVQDGHLLHIGPVSEGLYTDVLTTTLRSVHCDHGHFE